MAVRNPPATPEYLDWSETHIGFDRRDHPLKVPRPGHHALVLEAQIGGYNLKKVFIDAGSGLNIIYADTLRAMNISLDSLTRTSTTFHGIVPMPAVLPLGSIVLDVLFGGPDNFRREALEFDVVDWPSQYNAILGRPMFSRFMAVPHYTYLKLKIPGPNGVITVDGCFERSDRCDQEFSKIAESFGMHQELVRLKETTDLSLLPHTERAAPEMEFDTSSSTRAHQVHPTDASKTALVSSTLGSA
jgi:hypothetical protein